MKKSEQYHACREMGMTYQEVGDMYGVSKQAVHNSVNSKLNIKPTSVVFNGLRTWMRDNHVTITALEHKTGMNLRHSLANGNISIAKINAILKATGETYESMFVM